MKWEVASLVEQNTKYRTQQIKPNISWVGTWKGGDGNLLAIAGMVSGNTIQLEEALFGIEFDALAIQ